MLPPPNAGVGIVTTPSPASKYAVQRVRIVDFDMPFGRMVYFMVKWSLQLPDDVTKFGMVDHV